MGFRGSRVRVPELGVGVFRVAGFGVGFERLRFRGWD